MDELLVVQDLVALIRLRRDYCGLPEGVVLIKHQPDHIIATKHGGQTLLENLAYACYACNHQKGSDIAIAMR